MLKEVDLIKRWNPYSQENINTLGQKWAEKDAKKYVMPHIMQLNPLKTRRGRQQLWPKVEVIKGVEQENTCGDVELWKTTTFHPRN